MTLRLSCVVPAMCLIASTGLAQTGLRSASLPDRQPTGPMPPPIVLRSGSLPDRSPSQPIPPAPTDGFLSSPHTYDPNFPGRRPHRRFQGYPFGYAYGYGPYPGAAETMAPPVAPQNGYLHLQMQPGNAQVFVDGYYLGAVDDFRRLIPGRSIEAGPHRVELRATGYETATFDVMIPPNETVSYRSDLRSTAPVVARSSAPGVPKTFYVIPGCYAGDKPPRATKLPRGCDRAKVRALPPEPVLSVKR